MKQKEEASLIVKILFQKSVFNLGKNITSYSGLVSQIKNRFPEIKNFKFTFNEKHVWNQNFEEVFNEQLEKGQKSIKLELNELPGKINTQKKQKKQTKSKKFSFDPKEFDDDKQVTHKYKEAQYWGNQFQQLSVNDSENLQIKETSKKEQIDLQNIKIKVLMGNQLSQIKKEVGEEYTWSWTFVNQNKFDLPKGFYVREVSTNKLVDIGGMAAKQAEQILFGPFVEKQAGKFTRFYQIVYKKSEQILVPIGNKFGFVCQASKKMTVKQLQNKVYKRVNELRNFSTCQKSAQYIVAKLNDLGIDEKSIQQYKDEDLIDMMESLNLQL